MPLSLWQPSFPPQAHCVPVGFAKGNNPPILSLPERPSGPCESVAHTSRHGLLGQASPALLFHTITLESRGTLRGAHSFPKISVLEELPLRAEDIKEPDRNQRPVLSWMCFHGSVMGSFVVGRSQIWAFPTLLARPYLQKRIPTSPMQEAKQGAENFSACEKAGGPQWPIPGCAQENRQGLYPKSSPHLSALCPLEGQGGTSVLVPTCPGLPCPLAWKAQGSSGPGPTSLHGFVGTTLRHVKVWLGQRKLVLWY